MNEKITRRVKSLTTLFSLFIMPFEFSVGDVLKTKNFSAKAKLDNIKTTKRMTSHSISVFTRDNYDN